MAVYQHRYQPYEGALTSGWRRFLVVPRYAYEDLVKSRIFVAQLFASAICPLIFMLFIYTHHNANAITVLGLSAADLLRIDANFFHAFLAIQSALSFVLTVMIGPVLVSRDLSNNGLPLYLSRPFTRAEYIFGKMSVLGILMAWMTWIPGLLLFLFQCYLDGSGWWREYWWIALSILCGSLALTIILALLSMAISAWVKWRSAASGALIAVFLIPTPIGFAIENLFGTKLGHLLSLATALDSIRKWLFVTSPDGQGLLSVGEAWAVWAAYGLVALWMLSRKLRAWEVVS